DGRLPDPDLDRFVNYEEKLRRLYRSPWRAAHGFVRDWRRHRARVELRKAPPRERQARKKRSQKTSALNQAPTEYETATDADLGIIAADRIDPQPPDWHWLERLGAKKLNLVVGEGKQGKSLFTNYVAAQTSTGGPWCDGSGSAQRGTVLVLSAEDDPED